MSQEPPITTWTALYGADPNYTEGSDPDPRINKLRALAVESREKGEALQKIDELQLVGNAYVGMAQRIEAALEEGL